MNELLENKLGMTVEDSIKIVPESSPVVEKSTANNAESFVQTLLVILGFIVTCMFVGSLLYNAITTKAAGIAEALDSDTNTESRTYNNTKEPEQNKFNGNSSLSQAEIEEYESRFNG